MHLQRRVLITGGSGFLGSHLCEKLLAEGVNVLCVDNFFTGNRQNIEHLLDDKHFELIRHDVTFPLYVEVDEIYNLACPASPIYYQRDPVQTTKTSVHGAINMLGLANATLSCLSRTAFETFAKKHPELYKSLVGLLAKRLRETDTVVAAGSFLSLEGRVARTMLELAEHFGQEVGSGRIVIRQKISQNDLATMAGVETRERDQDQRLAARKASHLPVRLLLP